MSYLIGEASLSGNEPGALMHIPTTGWASYLRIRVYVGLVAESKNPSIEARWF